MCRKKVVDLSEKLIIEFNSNDYLNLSDDEVFDKKFKDIRISENYYNIVKREMFDEICESKTIVISSKFFVESEKTAQMIQTSKENYDKAVSVEKSKLKQYEEKTKNKIMNANTSRSIIPSPGYTETVNGGTLNLIILLSSSDGIHYNCASFFNWETMPIARHTDAFGLTCGPTASFDAQSAYGLYELEYTISYLSGTDYTVTEYTDSYEVKYGDLKHSSDSLGYAFEIDLPPSTSSSSYPYTTVSYKSMIGALSYDGAVTAINAYRVNHSTTYAHKRLNLIFNGIDFSIPFGAGFSITLASTYDQVTEEHTWTRS